MDKRTENQIVQAHLAQLKLLQLPLLQRAIPSYIRSLPLEEQQVLYKRARK